MKYRIAVLALLASSSSLFAATNSWKGTSGTWDTQSNWSLNQRPANSQDIAITNTGTFAVTVDDHTASSAANSMTILSLSMSNSVGASKLSLTNRPSSTSSMTFTILRNAELGTGSTLDIVSLTNIGRSVTVKASNFFNNGSIFLRSNTWLMVTNTLSFGTKQNQIGVLTNFGGTVIARNLTLGNATGAQGLWSILGGTNLVAETLQIGSETGTGIVNQVGGKLIVGGNASDYGFSIAGSANSTGSVTLANGQFTPGTFAIGERGFGQLIVSNGVLQVGTADVGVLGGAHGVWQIRGGTDAISSLGIGENNGATGEVWITGGRVDVVDLGVGGIDRGSGGGCGVGNLVISNGEVAVGGYFGISECFNSVGTVTIAGGSTVAGFVSLGGNNKGVLWLTGGELVVTNTFLDGRFDFRYGSESRLICSGGVLIVREMDLGFHAPQQTWEIAGGTSVVQQVAKIVRGVCRISGGRLELPVLQVGWDPLISTGGGQLVISGGEVQVTQSLEIGGVVGMTGAVNIVGGSLTIAGRLDLGAAPGGAGIMTVAGGNLKITSLSPFFEYPAFVGAEGAGQLIISSGTFNASTIWVGGSAGSVGTLMVSGGLVDAATGTFGTILVAGESTASTGIVAYMGGNLDTRAITLGDAGFGYMSVSSNADFHPLGVIVGKQSGAVGGLTIQGGSLFGSPMRTISDLQVGVALGSTGTVWMTDGVLRAGSFGGCFPGGGIVAVGEQGSGRVSATNCTLILYNLSVGNKGTLECVNSQLFAQSGGCSIINSNVILLINSTASFSTPMQNTGTIIANGSTLTFSGSLTNSGTIIATNAVVQFPGGISNTGNVVLGPDQFVITSVLKSNNDIIVNWQAFGGNRYRIQAATNPLTGYADISPDIVAAGNGLSITNFTDAGALTNPIPRFYHVRQLF